MRGLIQDIIRMIPIHEDPLNQSGLISIFIQPIFSSSSSNYSGLGVQK